ncbi:MAG: DUF2723 domain-containing protein [Caldilineales bacterium]|nr:DUF2723 domain-containing protein [Caldilineales bacterium]
MVRLRPLWPPLALTLAGLALYGLTLAPTVTGTDAGELILAAVGRGVAHAPGFPTWLVLAGGAAALPWGEPAWRLNAFSALMAALTLPVLGFWLREMPLPEAIPVRAGRRDRRRHPPAVEPTPPPRVLVAGVVLTFAVGRSFWPWATAAEVYTLNAFLVAVSLLGLWLWVEGESLSARRREAALAAAALAYGLALGAHLATTALLAPAIGLWLYRHRRRLHGRLILAAGLALALGLSTYAALPLRAAAQPILNWGDPDTLPRFWRHITAAQYRSNLELDPTSLGTGLRFGLELSFWQFGPLGLPLIGWGLVEGWRRRLRPTGFLLAGMLPGILYAVAYTIADDRDAYYILVHLLALVPLLWGLHRAGAVLIPRLGGRRWLWTLAGLIPLSALVVNGPVADRRDYRYHEVYFRNLTASVAPGGAIFTRDWQFYSPSLYYQHVLGERRDLRIVDVELMRRDWYLNQLEEWYPELTGPAAAELAAYRQLRDAWEQDPRRFEQDVSRVEALQTAYIAAINALIRTAAAQGEVHLSPDQEPGVGVGYEWVPVGLTFRLLPPGTAPTTLPDPGWDLTLFRGRWSRLPDEPARKVARSHSLMLQHRALYLAERGDLAATQAALDLAAQIDPTDPRIPRLRQRLGG